MQKVELYRTSDGKEFRDYNQASMYEAVLTIRNTVGQLINLEESSADDLLFELLDKSDVVGPLFEAFTTQTKDFGVLASEVRVEMVEETVELVQPLFPQPQKVQEASPTFGPNSATEKVVAEQNIATPVTKEEARQPKSLLSAEDTAILSGIAPSPKPKLIKPQNINQRTVRLDPNTGQPAFGPSIKKILNLNGLEHAESEIEGAPEGAEYRLPNMAHQELTDMNHLRVSTEEYEDMVNPEARQ
jgi:hypothetical protein